jgi:two-component system nitrate/nitrite response regulator NarL
VTAVDKTGELDVMDTSAIRVLVIDDHEIFRAGLRLLLELEPGVSVIGEARNKTEALDAAQSDPDIILLDLDLGSDSGLELLPELMNAAPDARILVLTGVLDPGLHLRAVCLGAIGVVRKLEAPRVLTKAIRKVHAGEAWLNRTMVASAMSKLQAKERKEADPERNKIASLTARESEIIALIGEGLRNKAIGERLCISEKTVRHHLTSIFNKLEVSDRLELMIYSYQHGLAKVRGKET